MAEASRLAQAMVTAVLARDVNLATTIEREARGSVAHTILPITFASLAAGIFSAMVDPTIPRYPGFDPADAQASILEAWAGFVTHAERSRSDIISRFLERREGDTP